MENTFIGIDCPVCGGDSFKTVLEFTPNDFLSPRRKAYYNLDSLGIDMNTKFYIKKCKACSFELVNPRLKNELYDIVYNEAKVGQLDDMQWIHEECDQKYLYNTYSKWSAINPFLKALSYKKKSFCKVNNEGFERLRMLDYGCGNGNTLELAALFGIDAIGVDIDQTRLMNCTERGLKVCTPDVLSKDESFDIIISTSVIEHVSDVNAYLDYIYSRLNEDGIFSFNGLTPQVIRNEIKAKAFKNVMPLEHINYFNKKSLNMIMEKHGFVKADRFNISEVIDSAQNAFYPILRYFLFKGFYPSGNFDVVYKKSK